MKIFRAELHVHTVLSPCAELEMQPPLIVREAIERGIDILAITDHNATANILSVIKAAHGTSLTILPGMEVQTVEEVHGLCLFDTMEQAEQWQKIVSAALPPLKNNAEYFGDQILVDENGDFVAREEQLLLTSANLTLENAWKMVTELGGLFIPAHIDRKANGLLPILGLIPPDIPFDCLEISRNLALNSATSIYPQIASYPLIQGGDAHILENILGLNHFQINQPTINEIKSALAKACDRTFFI